MEARSSCSVNLSNIGILRIIHDLIFFCTITNGIFYDRASNFILRNLELGETLLGDINSLPDIKRTETDHILTVHKNLTQLFLWNLELSEEEFFGIKEKETRVQNEPNAMTLGKFLIRQTQRNGIAKSSLI